MKIILESHIRKISVCLKMIEEVEKSKYESIHILIVMISQVYTNIKTYQIVYFNYIQYMPILFQ